MTNDAEYDIEIEEERVDVDQHNEIDSESESMMQEPFNPSKINIISKQDTLRNIIERIKHDEIDMLTDFQRNGNLWDKKKQSRLIESILIRFPLPAFYFDASEDEKWLIVDGLQRLSAIQSFVINKSFKLTGLEYLIDLEGKRYDELSRTYLRRIDECSLTLFLIQPGTPDPVKYSIFRRINTGGLVLNDQEIRNAMTTPEVRIFLARVANNDYLKKMMGEQSKRMADQELVLRFLAFKYLNYLHTKKNISSFLDEMIQTLEMCSEKEYCEYELSFQSSMRRCYDLFGESAFEKITENSNNRKNKPLFEVWTTALSNLSQDDIQILNDCKLTLCKKHEELLQKDEDYFRAITYSTQKKEHYRIRCEKVHTLLNEVLND